MQAEVTPLIRDVRGRGLWIGVDIEPGCTTARDLVERLAAGVLSKETHETVIRFAPPLTITQALMDRAVEIFRQVAAGEAPGAGMRRGCGRRAATPLRPAVASRAYGGPHLPPAMHALAPAQLTQHLQRGLRPLYTLHGDEPLLVQEAADAIRAAARSQGYTERSVHTVAGAHFDWSAVLAAGGSLSLFADKQIVEIRIPSGKPGKDGSAALQQVAEAPPGNDSTLTLVLLPRLDSQTKKSAPGSPRWKAAASPSRCSRWSAPRCRNGSPSGWRSTGQRVVAGEEGQRTLQFFADRVEGNLLAAHQEIQKLALLYPAGELRFEQVEAPC